MTTHERAMKLGAEMLAAREKLTPAERLEELKAELTKARGQVVRGKAAYSHKQYVAWLAKAVVQHGERLEMLAHNRDVFHVGPGDMGGPTERVTAASGRG